MNSNDIQNSYYDDADPKMKEVLDEIQEQKKSSKTFVHVIIKNDSQNEDVSALISAALLMALKNRLTTDSFTEGFSQRVEDFKSVLNVTEDDRVMLDSIDGISVVAADVEAQKTAIAVLVKITGAAFNGEEWDGEPLKIIHGDLQKLFKFVSDEVFLPYTQETDYALWKYKFQPDIVGEPGDYVVVTDSGELEIVKADKKQELLDHYRFLSLTESLE